MSFTDVLKKLGIKEDNSVDLTKAAKKAKSFTKIDDNMPMKADYNYMADLIFLPETKKGYRYGLVVTDLATHEFDIEPLKNKEPATTLAGMKKMFSRKWLKKPYATLAVDAGGEFKGVFKKYLFDNNILEKVAVAGRHTQQSSIENLNRTLGKILNGCVNKKEKATGEVFKEWTEILPELRTELNKHRKRTLPNDPQYKFPDISTQSKYKVGDVVHYLMEAPKDALGGKLGGGFREGDQRWSQDQRKITQVFSFAGKVSYRYQLEGKTNVSYTDNQLMVGKKDGKKDAAPAADQSTFLVNKLLDKRKKGGKIEYLVWWKTFAKKDATWEPRKQLIEDKLKSFINEFEKSKK